MDKLPKQSHLIGIGEILWDVLPAGKLLGGAPANFVYHARALGGDATLVTAVGDDDEGRAIDRQLVALGLGTEYVANDPIHPTSSVQVTLDEHGKPSYMFRSDVAWDFMVLTDGLKQLARKADAICFGTLAQRSPVTRAAIQGFLAESAPTALRMLDINLRQSFYSKEVIEQSLRLANALKINDEELATVAAMFDLHGDELAQLQQIEERYQLQLVALTRGARGSLLLSRGKISRHEGFPVQVVDTIGAGDAFTAALVMGFLGGQDLDAVHDHASRLAAFVCTQKGATPAHPAAFPSYK